MNGRTAIETKRFLRILLSVFAVIVFLTAAADSLWSQDVSILEVLPHELEYRVELNPSSQSVEEGERVQFHASLSPPAERAEYCFTFGDGIPCTWSRNRQADYTYPRPGAYRARVTVRLRQKFIAESPPVTIQVKARQAVRSLTLTPDKTRVDVDDRVTFRAVINPPQYNVNYTFNFGDGERKESDIPEAEHRYQSEGTFRAFVTASVNGETVAESAPVSVAVEKIPEMPVARIEPERMKVTQGQIARFESKSTPEGQIRESWRGPGGQTAEGSRFDVHTKGLDPREYEIVLSVTDGRNRSERSVALEVTAPSAGKRRHPAPRPVDKTVKPSPFPWSEIIAAILLVAGFYVASKIMKRRRGKRFPQPSLTIRPVLDSGDQKMEDSHDLPSLPAVRLRPEADPGEQEIESSGEITADERREHG